jgi:hypothetical protein
MPLASPPQPPWWEQLDMKPLPCVALAALCVASIPIVIVSVVQWRMVREAECEAEVKQAVIAQGMDHGLSPAAIERLLRAARPSTGENAQPAPHAQKCADIERDLKKDLAQRGWSAAEIERVLQATSVRAPSSSGQGGWVTVEQANKDVAFIKELIQGGRSANEIARILRATARASDPAPPEESGATAETARPADPEAVHPAMPRAP